FSRKKIGQQVKKLAEDYEKKQLKNKSGLYRLDPNFELLPFNHNGSETSFCIFIHGSASSTEGSFAGIKSHVLWKDLQTDFGKNLLVVEYGTLTTSPMKDALLLLKALTVHEHIIINQKFRGGLLRYIIRRYSTQNESSRANSKEDISVVVNTNRSAVIE